MLKIIVVDDSHEDRVLVERVLHQCKILNPILLFGKGSACIDHIQKICSETQNAQPEPSILFIDLLMPETSGLEVLQFLQSHEYAQHSISIMVSGLKDIKAINEGYQLGAKTFLLKPINTHDVVQVLNSLNDRIVIDEAEQGYHLHWQERLEPSSDLVQNSSRSITLSA